MPYTILADADHPAFVIYLIDMSGSMTLPCGNSRRIDVVADAISRTLRRMISRSLTGDEIRPRYALSMIGYNSTPFDLIGGVKTIDELETFQPRFNPTGGTNTAAALRSALDTLRQFLPNIQDCPAPLICHLTDGDITDDQMAKNEALAAEIRAEYNMDGNVLLENIYIGENLLSQPINPHAWQGLQSESELSNKQLQHLCRISSPLPQGYADALRLDDYNIRAGSKMLIPAELPEMVELAFAMSGATGAAPQHH